MDEVTLSLPNDTRLPVPVDRWHRVGGRIVATYTVEELAWSLAAIGHSAGHKRLTELRRESRLRGEARQLRMYKEV